MAAKVASIPCYRKERLLKVPIASSTCSVKSVETIGKRIERLRNAKGWSRPELGRQMATAIGKPKPFSGEMIRLYEQGENRPGVEARTALAKVFGKTDAYIEFGITPNPAPANALREPGVRYDALPEEERQLLERYRRSPPRWQLSMRLLAMVAAEDMDEVAGSVNVVLAKVFAKRASDIKPVPDERVEAALATSRHGFPPGRQRQPLLRGREGGALPHKADRAKVKRRQG